MNNYIQIYNNVLSDNYCDELREKFDSAGILNPPSIESFDQGPMSFSQINLNQHPEWGEDIKKLTTIFTKYINQYKQDCAITPEMWPNSYAFEEIRLKRYLNNNKDEFAPHVDAVSLASVIRFLVFFVYLDDNEKGETAFPQLGVASPCKKGSLLMFPPLWPWLHAGLKPIDKPKYMLGSYLHYVK